jgi:hypothetical protein
MEALLLTQKSCIENINCKNEIDIESSLDKKELPPFSNKMHTKILVCMFSTIFSHDF